MSKKIGLVVGKFAPFHKGHKYLIDTALAESEYVYLITYANPDFGYSQVNRLISLCIHYTKEVNENRLYIVSPMTDEIPHNDAHEHVHRLLCATEIFRYVARQVILSNADIQLPNTVFSSETYGQPFADCLSKVFGKRVDHRMVDLKREKFPISATKIRAGGHDEWIIQT